jgi:hypothetical protein
MAAFAQGARLAQRALDVGGPPHGGAAYFA